MITKKLIDFLIIGAQKSATTSLFKYLSSHPSIYMPQEKEIDYFSDNSKYSRGVNWYLKEYFSSASSLMIWGEASPHYMCYDYVPERIFNTFPGIKLIASLRNPITRAYSHYRMAVRRKSEERPFDVCIEELISRANNCDNIINYKDEFIRFGEYGRILKNYLKYFPADQIKLIFMEKLYNEPYENMEDIFNFLGVSKEFKSKIFSKQYHLGGEKRFFLLENILMNKWIKKSLRTVLPPKFRRALGFWLITQLTVKAQKDQGPRLEIQKKLKDYYSDDVKLLENLFKIKVPWEEFR